VHQQTPWEFDQKNFNIRETQFQKSYSIIVIPNLQIQEKSQ
jgi:hypothetical protein